MRYGDIKSGKVNLNRRAVERGGWLEPLPRDPGEISDRGWNQPDEPDPWATLTGTRP